MGGLLYIYAHCSARQRPGASIMAAARRAMLNYLRAPVAGPATTAGIGRVARLLSSSMEEAAKGSPPSLGKGEAAADGAVPVDGCPEKKVDPKEKLTGGKPFTGRYR